MQRPCE